MGCAREPRPSELKMQQIFQQMLHLNNCIWHGKRHMLDENVKEYIVHLHRALDEVVELMEKEFPKDD